MREAHLPAPLPLPPGPLTQSDRPVILSLQVRRSWTSKVLGGLAPLVVEGRELWCVDSGNCFDPYAFSTHARKHGIDPEAVLDRIQITRAFTIHQLEAVVTEMLPPLATREPRPLVAVLGLDHLFLEESLPLRERRQVLGRIAETLRGLRARGMMLLVTHDPPRERGAWWKPLIDRLGDCRGLVREGEGGMPVLRFEQR